MLVLLVPGASHLDVWKCCMTAGKKTCDNWGYFFCSIFEDTSR